jgi:hypothetical protein
METMLRSQNSELERTVAANLKERRKLLLRMQRGKNGREEAVSKMRKNEAAAQESLAEARSELESAKRVIAANSINRANADVRKRALARLQTRLKGVTEEASAASEKVLKLEADVKVSKARILDGRKAAKELEVQLSSARKEKEVEMRRADAAEHALGEERGKRAAKEEELAQAAMVVTAQAASLRTQLVSMQEHRKDKHRDELRQSLVKLRGGGGGSGSRGGSPSMSPRHSLGRSSSSNSRSRSRSHSTSSMASISQSMSRSAAAAAGDTGGMASLATGDSLIDLAASRAQVKEMATLLRSRGGGGGGGFGDEMGRSRSAAALERASADLRQQQRRVLARGDPLSTFTPSSPYSPSSSRRTVANVENLPPPGVGGGASKGHWLRDELLELAALESELSSTMRASEL